tara:strand:- start:989 stop:1669 length:681 start_codon:yes stop_codon:yes gene_type:complete
MGANAQIAVPAFTAGQILTAAQQTQINTGIPVFATTTTRDAAFGGAGEKTLAQGQFCYLESTGKLQVYNGTSWVGVSSMRKVARFTASGTWTVPAGVTYAVAHIRGGGGGIGGDSGPTGGTSSVAFASGTVSCTGGPGMILPITNQTQQATNGPANSGLSGAGSGYHNSLSLSTGQGGNMNSGEIVAGADVTPAASITITIGAGGIGTGAGSSTGGTGYVWIEYEE